MRLGRIFREVVIIFIALRSDHVFNRMINTTKTRRRAYVSKLRYSKSFREKKPSKLFFFSFSKTFFSFKGKLDSEENDSDKNNLRFGPYIRVYGPKKGENNRSLFM